MAGKRSDYSDRCHNYARAVVDGAVVACRYVRLACQRHLDDLEKTDWPYIFDEAKANRACKFVEMLPHVKGKWAARHEKIKLEGWQCFLIGCLFGWVNRESGLRRYRKALWLIPRKNSKSTIAAAIGLYMFAADKEFGSEVYSGATSEAQAWEVFRPAKQMAERTPGFRKQFGVEVNAKSLVIPDTGSRFVPVIGKPGDGSSPSCAIHDEYHEHQTDDQVDTMETGMMAREQPIQLIVTTAGDNLSGPCYYAVVNARKVLEGAYEQDDLFYVEYGIDEADDWACEAALKKANPNYGVSVFPEVLLPKLEEAKHSARKQGIFQTKHLNRWVGAKSAYFNVRKWMALENPDLKLADMKGRTCFGGLDLATREDIVSRILLFPPEVEGENWRVFHFGYLPEETVSVAENEHYQGWVNEGWLIATDGQVTDHTRVRDDLVQDSNDYTLREVGYDPAQANMMASELMEHGISVVEVRPIVLNFSEPMKDLGALITSGKIEHNGDPVLTWMLSNVVAKEDAKDNVYPRKEKPENKIDGVVALIMALARARVVKPKKRSIFNEATV